MVDYNSKEILISLHIPKCGGTSFESVLRNWFPFGFHRHYMNHQKMKPPVKAGFKNKIRKYFPLCIHGHFDEETDKISVYDYYPNACQFIAIYRDPLEIQMSYYFYVKKLFNDGNLYWKGKKATNMDHLGKDLDEHLEGNSNYQWLTRFIPWEINQENYLQVLQNNFIHIGITEDLQKSVNILAEKLNKKPVQIKVENSTTRFEKPSESAIRKFKEQHKLEYAFYDYVCKLNK